MTKKESAIKKLEIANAKLLGAWQLIKELNTKDHQFDYVSDPRLSDIVDKVKSKVDFIYEIVYQEV